MVEKIQAFSVQSGNGSLSSADREDINKQSLSLVDEASTLIKEAEFNGTSLFSESGINLEQLKSKLDLIRNNSGPINQESLIEIQDEISLARADIGAQQNAIVGGIAQIENERNIQSNRRSEIGDTDFANEFAERIRQEIQFEAQVKVFNHRISAEESLVSLLS